MVAADLRRRGFGVALAFGEDNDFDLILIGEDRLERVQVKYVASDGAVIKMKCFSHALTNGRIRKTKHYTASGHQASERLRRSVEGEVEPAGIEPATS